MVDITNLSVGYLLFGVVIFVSFIVLYLLHLDRILRRVPKEAEKLSPHRWTVEEIQATYDRIQNSPVDVKKFLSPRQQRRYIITGGSGKRLNNKQAEWTLIHNRTYWRMDHSTSFSPGRGS